MAGRVECVCVSLWLTVRRVQPSAADLLVGGATGWHEHERSLIINNMNN